MIGFDWCVLFVEGRVVWGVICVVLLFGYVFLEKLVVLYKLIIVYVWLLYVVVLLVDCLLFDVVLVEMLLYVDFVFCYFCLLFVMGILGWCDVNVDVGFYLDMMVFWLGCWCFVFE